MEEILKEFPAPILIVAIIVLAWFFKFFLEKAWDAYVKSKEKSEVVKKEYDESLRALTLATIELKTEMKTFREAFITLAAEGRRNSDNINILFQKYRDLES